MINAHRRGIVSLKAEIINVARETHQYRMKMRAGGGSIA